MVVSVTGKKVLTDVGSDDFFQLSSTREPEAVAAPRHLIAQKGCRPGEEGQHVAERYQPEPVGQETVAYEAAAEQS